MTGSRLCLDKGRAWSLLSEISSTTGVSGTTTVKLGSFQQNGRTGGQSVLPLDTIVIMYTCLQLAQTELSHLQLSCYDLSCLLGSLLLLLHLLDLCQRSQPLFNSVGMPAGISQVLLKPAGHGSSNCWPQ